MCNRAGGVGLQECTGPVGPCERILSHRRLTQPHGVQGVDFRAPACCPTLLSAGPLACRTELPSASAPRSPHCSPARVPSVSRSSLRLLRVRAYLSHRALHLVSEKLAGGRGHRVQHPSHWGWLGKVAPLSLGPQKRLSRDQRAAAEQPSRLCQVGRLWTVPGSRQGSGYPAEAPWRA